MRTLGSLCAELCYYYILCSPGIPLLLRACEHAHSCVLLALSKASPRLLPSNATKVCLILKGTNRKHYICCCGLAEVQITPSRPLRWNLAASLLRFSAQTSPPSRWLEPDSFQSFRPSAGLRFVPDSGLFHCRLRVSEPPVGASQASVWFRRSAARGGVRQPCTGAGRSAASCSCCSPTAAPPSTWTRSSRPSSPGRSEATSASRWTSSSPETSRGKPGQQPLCRGMLGRVPPGCSLVPAWRQGCKSPLLFGILPVFRLAGCFWLLPAVCSTFLDGCFLTVCADRGLSLEAFIAQTHFSTRK